MTTNLIIFGIVNLFASSLSAASGGGGGLIATPTMVLVGLSPAQAIATAKFGGFGISLGASGRFYKEKITDKRTVIIFSIFGAVGAFFGSLALVHFSDQTELIQKIMGAMILLVGIPMLYFRQASLTARTRSRPIKILGLIVLTLVVLLQAALGSGIGSLQMIILITFFGMTALVASATRRAMQLTVAAIALAVYIISGLVDYKFGLVGFFTSLVGGVIGAHIAIKKGNKFVINLFAVVSAVLALQLLIS